MVQSIFDTQDEERRADDPWLSEFSAIDPSIAPDRVEPELETAPEAEPDRLLHFEPPPPAAPEPPKQYDPYGDDEEPFDGYETVVSEPAETARRSGLAWSIGIMFFSSVAFMLLLGWGADLILGTAPWGLVGGIVLGSLIGFVQFFRTSSRLFPGREPITEVKPLISPPEDDDLRGPF
jgi:hypothetical protein